MRVLLLSTYDMGRQPFGLASPAAWLREAGMDVVCADLSKDRLPQEAVVAAGMVGFFLPMHTATRLALPVIDRVRGLNPDACLVAYGLYAPLNAELLRGRGIDEILSGEFEAALVEVASRAASQSPAAIDPAAPAVARLAFKVPDRGGLPLLSRYAGLQIDGEKWVAGYTEASRGCKHRCRHCPIVPVYDGRFRIVAPEVVLGDVRAQVAVGARHITFGDPDFFNGIRHARTVVEGFAREFPGVTYNVTIKVEHLLKHADVLPLLRDTGCAFITSAVETVDDRVLGLLEKGHTRADFERAVWLCAAAGVPLSPTFVTFTPWTTVESYREFLAEIGRLHLVEHVAPIQYAIRLLITDKSRLLELDDIRMLVTRFDPVSLTYPWVHPDPRVDRLHSTVSAIVGGRTNAPRADVFARVWAAAHLDVDQPLPAPQPVLTARAAIPYLTEPWYC